jgi:hypothetical protein
MSLYVEAGLADLRRARYLESRKRPRARERRFRTNADTETALFCANCANAYGNALAVNALITAEFCRNRAETKMR